MSDFDALCHACACGMFGGYPYQALPAHHRKTSFPPPIALVPGILSPVAKQGPPPHLINIKIQILKAHIADSLH